MAVENKNNKNGLAKEGKEASKFPKEHSSCSNGHARQTERGSAEHSPVPQTAVQCHLEAPEAAVEEHFRRNHGTRAQVSPPPFLQVCICVSAYLPQPHAHSDRFQVKGRQLITAIADSVRTTQLIPY